MSDITILSVAFGAILGIQYYLFSRHIQNLEKMLMAGSPSEYRELIGKQKISKNEIKNAPNDASVSEDNPIPMSEITGVQVDDRPRKEIHIVN